MLRGVTKATPRDLWVELLMGLVGYEYRNISGLFRGVWGSLGFAYGVGMLWVLLMGLGFSG